MDFMNEPNVNEEPSTSEESMQPETPVASEATGPAETKAQKFKRLAAPRIDKAAHAISLIGNLSGSAYEYTQEETTKMFDYLQQVLDDTKAKFEKTTASKDKFSF